jgi:SpoVK/Ycf46/Vps4 family AAA+-type ATPase
MDPYRDSIEHLTDELKRVDLLIQRALTIARDQPQGGQEYRGLLISEPEIDELLKTGEFLSQHWQRQEKNQRKLDGLDQKLAVLRKVIDERRDLTTKSGSRLTLSHLAERFGLSSAEVDLLLVAMAPELEPRYETLYAYLQDDVTRKRPSADLALNLICRSEREKLFARRFLAPDAPLIHFRVLELLEEQHDRQPTLLRKFLKIEDSVLRYLVDQAPAMLSIGSFQVPKTTIDSLEFDVITRSQLHNLVESVQHSGAVKAVVQVVGSGRAELHEAAAALSHQLQKALITVDLTALENESADISGLIRDATLLDAVLAVFAADMPETAAEDPHRAPHAQKQLHRIFNEFAGFIIALGPEGAFGELPPDLRLWKIELKATSFEQRRQSWQTALAGVAGDPDPGRLADTFRFGGTHIRQAVELGHSLASLRDPSDPKPSTNDLLDAGRALSGSNLRRFATVIQPRYTWSDLVLPDDKRQQLEHIAMRAKYRRTVHYEWGFGEKLSRGKGLNVLFAGQSGVGKTMAAEVLANEMSLELFQIDLSSVVSKYIGETEKHLAAIFREAEMSQSLLFFDEADSLFGKRTEVKDAHDRYSNLEVNYLLQRIEQFEGLVILATNMQRNLDEAFLRRMQEVIDFPFPNEALRERIWRQHVPPSAPVEERIDYGFLARQFKLSGGSIKNAVMTAAFLAASQNKKIGMTEMVRSVRMELQKQGKLVMKTDFGKYFEAAQMSPETESSVKN